jgi:hypothetical protein
VTALKKIKMGLTEKRFNKGFTKIFTGNLDLKPNLAAIF